MSVIDTAVYVEGERVAHGAAPADAITDARARNGIVWIGLRSPDPAELEALIQPLGLSPLAVRDALRGHQRSKLEQFGDMVFLVLQPARYIDETERLECSEVDLFVGADFVVTVQNDDLIDTGRVRVELEEHPEILHKGTFGIVWALISAVIGGYAPVLDGVENDIDEIEEEIFSDKPKVSRRIFSLQREVIDLQHATDPLREMLDRLQDIVRASTHAASAPAFHDLDDHARHVIDKVHGFRHTLDNALTVHASLVDQQSNEEMRRMTEFGLQQNDQVKKISSWAAILFAPTLVGTIYGMNFDNMPELHWPGGYYIALGLMVATSVTLYLVFKRKDWL
ncbi:magnesium/cobalt transporter CorA [Microbacterium aoyamense]|uniref:Magnesium/cobalt transporter CorA n=1 Tax=Microbacterium aoyamense TaxID=344166 RepID=A0ABN2Q0N2_9MICO|nr:magnesium and cobalt transport protein CorA [Microbacterium aoyamense]